LRGLLLCGEALSHSVLGGFFRRGFFVASFLLSGASGGGFPGGLFL